MRSASMNISCCLAALLLLSSSHGWTSRRMRSPFAVTRLSMSSEPKAEDDPCWQDLYDDDCSMSSAYSANFVAGKWVKSMPCASALDEDCDMGDLDVPGSRPEAGIDQVDVMDFLGLKKADSLSAKKPVDDKKGDVSP